MAFLNAYPWNAMAIRLSSMMLLALLWSISAQAHLLNMTKVKVSIDEDGKIEAVIDADLTKASGGGEPYFQLSQSATNNSALPDIIVSLKAASVLRYETQALEWQVASISWPAAEYRDFVSGLAWPMTRITLISQLPAEFQQGELSFKFTGAFQFEEPIALSVVYLPTEQSLSRWLVRDQQSPRYTIQSGHASTLPAGQVISRWLDYIWAGVVHILPYGWDHVLFVVGLWLGAVSLRQLMLWVTAFTAAHCVTLGLATYGAIVVPGTIVEPLIAISIAWIAIENILVKPGNWPRFIWVFGFGLLHGVGFAQVLRDIGLPSSGFFGTLVSFNIGVELAQIFILVCLMWISRSWRHIPNSAARVKQFGSYGIAAIALVITAQRLLA